jgi:hypothetical protein
MMEKIVKETFKPDPDEKKLKKKVKREVKKDDEVIDGFEEYISDIPIGKTGIKNEEYIEELEK